MRLLYIRFYEHTHMHRVGLVGWMDDGWTDEWDNTMIPGYMHVHIQKQILYILNTRRLDK